MRNHGFAIITVTLLAAGCTEDPPIPNEQPVSSANVYYPLTVGSYWVYDWYSTDSTEQLNPMSITDSCYVSGDTIIAGDTFAIVSGTFRGNPGASWLRDSLGYIISPSGRITMSSSNYVDTLYIWSSAVSGEFGFLKMCEIGDWVSVPAGSFRTINAKYTVINTTGVWPCFGIYDEHDAQYAAGIGLIRSSIQFTGSPACLTDLRLLRNYFIQ